MESTTLVTFLLETPILVSSVEIIGSWDGFNKSYPLEKDKRMGRGYWRGCHKFTGITCDGNTSVNSGRREGGLLMGGTYWYYYRFDGDVDYYDPVQPSTNNCPLLPGQSVNVLEVPTQAKSTQNGYAGDSTSSLSSAVFTMDPRAKYLSPKPYAGPTVTSPSSRTSKSSLAGLPALSSLFGKLLIRKIPDQARFKCSSAVQLGDPFKAEIQEQRWTRSAGEKLPFQKQDSQGTAENSPSTSALDNSTETVTKSFAKTGTNVYPALNAEPGSDLGAPCSFGPRAPPNTAQGTGSFRIESTSVHDDSTDPLVRDETSSLEPEFNEAAQYWDDLPRSASARSSSYFSTDPCSLSYGPSTEVTGQTSPRRSSHTDSPIFEDYRRDLLWVEDRPDAAAAYAIHSPEERFRGGLSPLSPRLLGYSLPEADQGSTLTIKPLPPTPFEPPDFRSPVHQNDNQTRVQSWNDGSEHPLTAFKELVDDLGYLGEVII